MPPPPTPLPHLGKQRYSAPQRPVDKPDPTHKLGQFAERAVWAESVWLCTGQTAQTA